MIARTNALLLTQSEKYGIPFIKLHSAPEPDEATPTDTPIPLDSSSKLVPTKLGVFSLKDEPKDLPSGSLFFKRNTAPPPTGSGPTPSLAAQARMASAALKEQAPPTVGQARQDSPQNLQRKSPERHQEAKNATPTRHRHSGEADVARDRKRTTPSGRSQAPESKKPRGLFLIY